MGRLIYVSFPPSQKSHRRQFCSLGETGLLVVTSFYRQLLPEDAILWIYSSVGLPLPLVGYAKTAGCILLSGNSGIVFGVRGNWTWLLHIISRRSDFLDFFFLLLLLFPFSPRFSFFTRLTVLMTFSFLRLAFSLRPGFNNALVDYVFSYYSPLLGVESFSGVWMVDVSCELCRGCACVCRQPALR